MRLFNPTVINEGGTTEDTCSEHEAQYQRRTTTTLLQFRQMAEFTNAPPKLQTSEQQRSEEQRKPPRDGGLPRKEAHHGWLCAYPHTRTGDADLAQL